MRLSLPLLLGLRAITAEQVREREQCTRAVTDVVIVGAGMAGIRAATRLEEVAAADGENDLDYIVLESQDRVGGRVRSTTIGARDDFLLNEGAVWLYDVPGNPLWQFVEEMGLEYIYEDFYNITMFNETGGLMELDTLWEAMSSLDYYWEMAANTSSDLLYDQMAKDEGVVQLLSDAGWDPVTSLETVVKWFYFDWNYAVSDISRFSWFNSFSDMYYVTDPRGYEAVPQFVWERAANPEALYTSVRVTRVEYDNQDIKYKAKVLADVGADGSCLEISAQRVISTVSTGVLNSNLIEFSPPLTYGSNPNAMGIYAKVWFEFATQFWDDTSFLVTVPEDTTRNCFFWKNLNDSIPSSNKLICYLTTEAYEAVMDQTTTTLTDETLLELLEPLRLSYGKDTVGTPIAMGSTEHKIDVDFGFGSYSHWQIGFNLQDYAQYYGGVEAVTGYCEHNGCNEAKEWVLHISGACSCYGGYESVHGAYWAGERSANHVLASLGYDVETQSVCDEVFEPYRENDDNEAHHNDENGVNVAATVGAVLGGIVSMWVLALVLRSKKKNSAQNQEPQVKDGSDTDSNQSSQ